MDKPDIQPLQFAEQESEYAKNFWNIPAGTPKYTYNNFDDVKITKVDNNVTLHYTPNDKNDLFSLVLRYNVGAKKIPMLEYIPDMLNTAGTMIGNIKPDDFRNHHWTGL